MTKEERKSVENFFDEAFTGYERSVIDEYATDKAIAFKNWREQDFWADTWDDETGKPFTDAPRWSSDSANSEYLTTEQLFDLFNSEEEGQ